MLRCRRCGPSSTLRRPGAAKESISYTIPTFKYRDKPLIYFGGREEASRDLRHVGGDEALHRG
ncbi:MAG: hypothetical protein U0837_04595 [Dehalococcoidia bacterium]